MVAYPTKTGAINLFNDNRPLSNLTDSNKMHNNQNLSAEALRLSPTQGKQKDTDTSQLAQHSERVCVSIVDMVNSTNIVSTIGRSRDIRKFYEIYLNKISSILKDYQAKIIKTVGDGIISYFPDTVETTNILAFENVLECCFAQLDMRSSINSLLMEQRLPTIKYRVSVDYGNVERTRLEGFDSEDLFGSTVNVCSKMNLFAPPDSIVVGNDFYRVIKSFKPLDGSYSFGEIGSYHCGGGKLSYPLYSVSRMYPGKSAHLNPLSFTLDQIRKYVVNGIPCSRAPKILLIDDELDDLFVLEEYLKVEGFEVKPFSSAREALRHYANEDPSTYDLIISDIRMPEINGFQLYYKLRSINNNLKIVFATCLEIVDEILTLIPELREDQIIQKPVEKESFIKTVRKNIG
jgi:class 3 adenylate cyclase/CheY-like chemotaxis protein